MTTITPSGTYASRTTAVPNTSPAPDTEKVFAVGYTQMGSVTEAMYVGDMTDVQAKTGGRLSVSPFYDCMDAYFLLGGAGGYVARNALSTITSATATLAGSSGASLVATAKNPGTWPNGTTIDVVVTGGTYTVKVTPPSGVVEQSYTLATQADAVTWAAKFSKTVNFAVGGGTASNPVAVTGSTMTGGTDNTAVDATSLESALTRFDDQYGSGTVTAWGSTASVLHRKVLAHVSTRARTAALDLADGDAATAVAAAQNLYQYAGRERACLNVSTLVLPGGPLGAVREVPWSVVIAAHASRADRTAVPGVALAGQQNGVVTANGGPIPGATLKRLYSEADQGLLEGSGLTYAEPQVVGGVIGVPVTAADRTITDYNDQTVPTEYSDARVLMTTEARIRAALAFANFGSLGGNGKLVSQATAACIPVLTDLYDYGVIGDGLMSYKQAFQVAVTADRPGRRLIVTALVYCAVSARIVQINIVHAVGA